jgi:NAD(P) transhydrogenase subunit alpha
MRIGVPKEIQDGEKRVATTPDIVEKLRKLGFSVAVESGAGEAANYSDAEYKAAGAEIVADADALWSGSEIIFKVRAPASSEISRVKPSHTVVSFVWPGQNPDLLKSLAATNANILAIDCVPRISRAQKLDALSSMANIAGYRAVIEAAHHFGRFFTGQITAAGKVPPAKVLVIGAGVAGLAAIGTAGGLGAVVRAFDTRPEVKEQVESMGAEFLMLDFKEEGSGQGGYAKVMSEEFIKAEMALFADQAKDVDIIITTALIPGKRAPLLITAEMVRSMKAGSVIVDLAAEQQGNCELTESGKVVVKHGVAIVGYTDLPSRLAKQSSQLYASNLWRLAEELCPKKNGQIELNLEDEILRGVTSAAGGKILWPPPPPKLTMAPAKPVAAAAPVNKAEVKSGSGFGPMFALVVGGLALLGLGQVAPPAFLNQMTVFLLACFIGYMVVWNVKAALHTPLMSVTNAISGIIVVGAILQVSSDHPAVQILAGVAILLSTINIVGGFLVTQRMLTMFKR